MPLPHITNSTAGVNKYDPVHNNIFEVNFTIPEPIRDKFGKDQFLITEHVKTVSGLDALNRGAAVGQQKFMGVDNSYIVPKLDNTFAEIQVVLTLNLRNETDNYILKIFKAWNNLGYNISTGERHLKKDYCGDWMEVKVGNREGTIYHDTIFKSVMMANGITGLDTLDYDSTEPQEITVTFVSDWWKETIL